MRFKINGKWVDTSVASSYVAMAVPEDDQLAFYEIIRRGDESIWQDYMLWDVPPLHLCKIIEMGIQVEISYTSGYEQRCLWFPGYSVKLERYMIVDLTFSRSIAYYIHGRK